MHSHDQAWRSFRARLNAESSLGTFSTTLAGCRGKPPFASDCSVRGAFDQLLNDELLALCHDDSLSIVHRLRHIGHLFKDVAAAISIYGGASHQARPIAYEAELLILYDFAVRACSASLALIQDAKVRGQLRGEPLADDLRSVAEFNCRFFKIVTDTCARQDFFSSEPRSALLLTLSRKTPIFIEELSADQLMSLYATASRHSSSDREGLLWRQIADLAEMARGDTILRMARLGTFSTKSSA